MAKRYRYRLGEQVSRSMNEQTVLEQLMRSQLDSNGEIQQVDGDWYSFKEHPDFKNIFDPQHKAHAQFEADKKALFRAEKVEKLKGSSKKGGLIVGSFAVLGLSYLALKANFFNLDYDPFVLSQQNAEPVPDVLLESLDAESPDLERGALLAQAEQSMRSAHPVEIATTLIQLERHVRHFPQDEDGVFWMLMLRSISRKGEVPNLEWMDWIDRTTLRVDKLARLQAWVGLRRGYRNEIEVAVKECEANDTVCQAALWVFDGDIDTALAHAKRGDKFAWRAVLDIVNDTHNTTLHNELSLQLKAQWPQSDMSNRLLADLAMAQGDWRLAYGLVPNIQLDDKNSVGWALSLAMMNQDYKAALSLTNTDDIQDHDNLVLLGSAAIQAGDYTLAKGFLTRAIEAGSGVKAHLLLARAHAGLNEMEDARAVYARNVLSANSRDERFYAVYIGVLLRNFRMAGQLMVDFPTQEPEYWFLALHTAIVREGPQQALDSIEGLVQTDIRLLWNDRIEAAWMPHIDRSGMATAAKSLIGQLRSERHADELVDLGLLQGDYSRGILRLKGASAPISSAKSFVAYEADDFELAISEADVALRFEANPDWLSTIKAIALLKAGSTSRGASAMDAILERNVLRANARLLTEGAVLREQAERAIELRILIDKPIPPRYFLEVWPQHVHHQLGDL